MESLVIGFIDPNIINYQSLLVCMLGYLLFMWGIFAVWVFVDAYRRYGKIWIAALFGLLVLPFNIPGFILYLISRPESKFAEDNNLGIDGALNVPIVHYTGQDGKIAMSLNIQLSPSLVNKPDLELSLDWDPTTSNISVVEQKLVTPNSVVTKLKNSGINTNKAMEMVKNISKKLGQSMKVDVESKETSLKQENIEAPEKVEAESKNK